jgi:hypothetical protein
MSIAPPEGLNEKGLHYWQTYGPRAWMMGSHFKSASDYLAFCQAKPLVAWKQELLDGVENPDSIDPKFLENLCKGLARLEDELEMKASREAYD